MNARRTIAIAVAGLAVLAAGSLPLFGQGFSGLGADAGGFAPVTRGRALTFPADHGAHPDHRIEWWYFTANLKDAKGESYGVQWTLFRQANTPGDRGEGWAARQLWMGHAAVTSASSHRFAEKFARGGVGQADVTAQPFAAFIDDWQMRNVAPAPDRLTPLELTASGKDFSYRLQLESDQPVVLQGEAGYSVKSERGQASYYYSQPYLKVTGTIMLDGKSVDVSGQGWIDREWSSQPLASDQTGWDWFSLHLESGDKLMLFRLRHAGDKSFYAGNWIDPDGKSIPLVPGDIVMTPGAPVRVAGRKMPLAWQIEVPSRGVKIQSAPLNPQSWMGVRFQYWEGPVTVRGSHQGVGYLEMTGYSQ